jgi:PPM family protein phosphatase
VHAHDVMPADVYLLCSDGLSDMLSDGEIAQVLNTPSTLEEACQALVDAANEAGGRDNISVILARPDGNLPAGNRSWWPFKR